MKDLETLERLINWDKWPTYTNSKQLSALEKAANEAFARGTFDGFVSYVLISHQVCEDYITLFLRHAQFTVRLRVLPIGFDLPKAKYEEPGQRDSDMFGKLLNKLDESLDFDTKKNFVEACRRLNATRNKFAHKLVDGVELADVKSLAEEYKANLNQVIDSFNDGDEQFSHYYTYSVTESHWDDYFEKRIKEAELPDEESRWKSLWQKFVNERARLKALPF